jgi:hypothetical protein
MAEMSPRRRRMTEDMTVRTLSPATQRSYLHAVSRFSRCFGRSPPHRLGLEDVREYQVIWSPPGFRGRLEPDGLCVALFLRRDAWL